MEEVVVEEVRKQRLDLAARAEFAQDGEQITETRMLLDDDYEDDQRFRQFGAALGDGVIEVG